MVLNGYCFRTVVRQAHLHQKKFLILQKSLGIFPRLSFIIFYALLGIIIRHGWLEN